MDRLSTWTAVASAAGAAALATCLVTALVLGAQSQACRLQGALRGVAVDYRVPGGCFVREADGRWTARQAPR